MITQKINIHACDSQLNSALLEGLFAMPSSSPISGGFGMSFFAGVDGLRNGSFGILEINMSKRDARLNEAFLCAGHGDIAPASMANGRGVTVWQEPQPKNANTAKISTFNKLYTGKYDSHSDGLYPQTDPPPQKGRAESQGGTIPIN